MKVSNIEIVDDIIEILRNNIMDVEHPEAMTVLLSICKSDLLHYLQQFDITKKEQEAIGIYHEGLI